MIAGTDLHMSGWVKNKIKFTLTKKISTSATTFTCKAETTTVEVTTQPGKLYETELAVWCTESNKLNALSLGRLTHTPHTSLSHLYIHIKLIQSLGCELALWNFSSPASSYYRQIIIQDDQSYLDYQLCTLHTSCYLLLKPPTVTRWHRLLTLWNDYSHFETLEYNLWFN